MKRSIFFGICMIDAVLLAGCIFLVIRRDRTVPVISFEEKEVFYEEGMEESLLLEGVSAYDEQDGDVSDSLLIEKIYETSDGTIIVTYAAVDSSNNVGKASRSLLTKEDDNSGVLSDDADQ